MQVVRRIHAAVNSFLVASDATFHRNFLYCWSQYKVLKIFNFIWRTSLSWRTATVQILANPSATIIRMLRSICFVNRWLVCEIWWRFNDWCGLTCFCVLLDHYQSTSVSGRANHLQVSYIVNRADQEHHSPTPPHTAPADTGVNCSPSTKDKQATQRAWWLSRPPAWRCFSHPPATCRVMFVFTFSL